MFSRKDQKPQMDVAINSEKLKQVKSYSYLGEKLTDNGRCKVEINTRIGMARHTLNAMKTNPGICPQKINMTFLTCYIYSIQLYGAETCTKKKKKRIERMVHEQKCGFTRK